MPDAEIKYTKNPFLLYENNSDSELHDDLCELLLRDEESPSGVYNHENWKIYTKGDVNSEAVLLTSVHESMHHLLNNSTAYGLLLVITAKLVQLNFIEKGKLLRLVNGSRISHEIYATYNSLLLTSSDEINHTLIKEDYPNYTKYIRQAEFLLQGFSQKHLYYPALCAIIEACFQNPNLPSILKHQDIFDISIQESPDQRLKKLSESLAPDCWINNFIQNSEDSGAAKIFVSTELYPENLSNAALEEYNQQQRAFQLSVYNSIRENLAIQVMAKDEHFVFLEKLMSHVRIHYPGIVDYLPQANTLNSSDHYTPVSHYESEVVVFKDVLPKAVLVKFSDYPENSYDKLLGKAEESAYIYLVARITERFIAQYQLQPDQKAWLEATHPDFLVAITIPTSLDSNSLVHVLLDDPTQLKKLEKHPMLCSVSMLLTSDKRWSEWYDAIDNYSTQFILFDLRPSEQIPRSFHSYDSVLYHIFHITQEGREYSFVILIAAEQHVATGVFFLPCSAVMAALLTDMLGRLVPNFRLLDIEKDISEDLLWLIRVAATRLLDESYFDFHALRSRYAQQGFANAQFFGT